MRKMMVFLLTAALLLMQFSGFSVMADTEAFTGAKVFFEDDFTAVPEEEIFTYNSSNYGTMTRNTETGEMIMTVEQYCLPDLVTPVINDTESTKIVYEVLISKMTGESVTLKMRIGNGSDSGWTYNFTDIYTCKSTGRLYVFLDRTSGTVSVYTEGSAEPVAVNTGYFPQGNTETYKAVQLMLRNSINSSVKSVNYDYIAAYALPDTFDFTFENIGTKGAELVTTHPLDTGSAVINVNGSAASLTRVAERMNRYRLTYAEELEYNTVCQAEISALTGSDGAVLIDSAVSVSLTIPPYSMKPYSGVKEFFMDDFTSQAETEIFTYTNLSGNTTSLARDTEAGEMVMTVSANSSAEFITPMITDTQTERIVYEVNISSSQASWWDLRLRVGNGAENGWTYNYKQLYVSGNSETGIYYIILDRITGTASVYKDGNTAPLAVLSDYYPANNLTGYKAVQFCMRMNINSAVKSHRFDYVAAYALPEDFSFEIEDVQNVSVSGMTIRTNKPIDTAGSVFTVNDIPAAVSKPKDTTLTYRLTFGQRLEYSKEYQLNTGVINGLDGSNMINSESLTFKTCAFAPGEYTPAECIWFDDFNSPVDVEPLEYNLGTTEESSGNVIWNRNIADGTLEIAGTNASAGMYHPSFWKVLDTPVSGGSFVIEYKLNNLSSNGNVTPGIMVSGTEVWLPQLLQSDTGSEGIFYYIVNLDTAQCTVYREGTAEPLAQTALTLNGTDVTRLRIKTATYKNGATVFDYAAMYRLPDTFSYRLRSSGSTGIYEVYLETSRPVNSAALSASMEGNFVSVAKTNDSFNTYTLRFAEHLKYGKTYQINTEGIEEHDGYSYGGAVMDFTTRDAESYCDYITLKNFHMLCNGEKTYDKFNAGTIEGCVNVECNVDSVPIVMIIAQYRNGSLIGCTAEPATITQDTVLTASYAAEEAAGTTVKIMLWNSMAEASPLVESIEAEPYSAEDITVDARFYPGWTKKAVVFSYDDGYSDDATLISMLNEQNLKGTFNLIAGWITNPETIKARYEGHEVANHSYNHYYANQHTVDEIKEDILQGKAVLQETMGCEVRGFAWPGNDFGIAELTEWLPEAADYARPSDTNGKFTLPEDWMHWVYTCHHKELPKYGEQFVSLEDDGELKLMSVWGHTYEFRANESTGTPSSWYLMEDFLEQLASIRQQLWGPTCIELRDYVQALKNLTITKTSVTNPSETVSVYLMVNGVKVVLAPGQTYTP